MLCDSGNNPLNVLYVAICAFIRKVSKLSVERNSKVATEGSSEHRLRTIYYLFSSCILLILMEYSIADVTNAACKRVGAKRC